MATAFGTALALGACGGGGGGGGQATPTPTPGQVKLDDPNAVMAALANKVVSSSGAAPLVQGTPPAPSTLTPKIDSGLPVSTSVPDGAATLPVAILSSQDMASLFAKVPGANSFFQVPILPSEGGKRLQVPVWKAAAKAEFSFVALQVLDFRLTLPQNIETGGEFCFEFTVETGAGEVTQPTLSCVDVADAFAEPEPNDQPPAALLPGALAGTWESACLDIEDVQATESITIRAVVLGLAFGADNSYNQFAEVFSDDACNSGAGSAAIQNGVFEVGGDTAYSGQIDRWQRPLNFNPIDSQEGVDLEPCYNLISLADDATTLYLGLPVTFTVDDGSGAPEVAGDCRAPSTRPTVVLNSLPFSKR
jgi:hypothetical protein